MSTPDTMPETPAEVTTTVFDTNCGPNQISFDGMTCTVITCTQDGMIFFDGPCPSPVNTVAAAAEVATSAPPVTEVVAVVGVKPTTLPTTGAGETMAIGAIGALCLAAGAVAVLFARRGARV
jgi:LPXTG-motif cell wall-anchored protein